MATTARGILFEGDLYMQAIVGGVLQKAVGPLESTQLSIQPQVNRQNMISRGRGRTGQIIETVGVAQETQFQLTLAEGNPDVLALGLMGTLIDLSVAAVASTAHNIAAVTLDRWSPIGIENLTGTVTVTSDPVGTTYVEGTDYVLDRQLGWIKPLSTGSIGDGDDLIVTAGSAAISGKRIRGATQTDLRARFTGNMRNLVDNSDGKLVVYEAVLAPDQAQDFLSGNFMTTSLSGTLKTPAGFTEPFLFDSRTTA